jgi:cell division protein FtsL
MTIPKEFIYIGLLCFFIVFLCFEKIKLSWEISTLHNNFENLQIEYDNLKDLNLKLITQFHIENSPASVEKIAKEKLGMEKKRPKKITIDDE